MYGWVSIADSDAIAERVKKAVELDGQGVLDSAISVRLAHALRALDDVDSMALFEILRKGQRLQCLQDVATMLREKFLVISR